MSRQTKDGQPFDQIKYQNEWNKQNMTRISGTFKKDFAQEFKDACKKLGVSQSEVIRQAMTATIEKAK